MNSISDDRDLQNSVILAHVIEEYLHNNDCVRVIGGPRQYT